ncbi:MAG: phosphatidate cytidylyltransferase [Gammaproteobacteria bacterium]|nr:phosphatidate cytidylyltransferase [Gammaproteobacteria bacterium]NNL50457.1 phosphatidate cytidylyltransferase [Woeseiaceae bacterium]
MLKTRIITAVVSLLLLGVILFVIPEWTAELLIGLLILAGAWEWSAFLEVSGSLSRSAYVAIIGLLTGISYVFLPAGSTIVLQIAFVWWFVAFIWTMFFPTPIPTVVRWACGALVLVPLFIAAILLYRIGPEKLLFALLIVWAADAGAYFAGKQFGRVKLAPSISPGKTWEGVFGGLLVVALLVLLGARWSDASLTVLLPFCLAVAALSIVGDLTISMFKRTAGVKDSGTLFPGHGGVLDRIDSVAAAAPLFALGLGWLRLV